MAAAVIFVAVAVLYALSRRDGARRATRRRAALEPVARLLDGARLTQVGFDYPVIEGRYRGRSVRIELHIDTIAVRKLPALWVLVSIRERLPVSGRMSAMLRHRNTEYWSPAGELARDLAVAADWPPHVTLRADPAVGDTLVAYLEPHLDFLAQPRAKEILITREGVRLAWLASEGDRARYLVMRQAVFADDPLDPDLAKSLLDRGCALADAVAVAATAR